MSGAAGYVGGRLVADLAARGHGVRAVVRRERGWLEAHDQRVADLETDPLEGVCEGIAAVIHLAGPNEVSANADPDAALRSTVVASRRLAAAAASAGVERFVYLSTMHVYGAAIVGGAVITEDTVPQPRHVYAIARLASEHLSSAQLPTVVLRLTNGVGAPAHPSVDRWSLVVNDLCRQAVLEPRLRLLSDGSGWRDFIPLSDVCRIITDLVTEPIAAGTYNLGSGQPRTIREIADLVADAAERVLGRRPGIETAPSTGTAPASYRISTDKLSALGVGPRDDISDAIDETLRFCAERKDELIRG